MPGDWITDDLIEPLAMAICFGGFSNPSAITDTPQKYWARVRDEVKPEYRAAAKRLLLLIGDGARVAPREPDEDTLAGYMERMQLASRHRAMKHWRAMMASLRTLWQMEPSDAR